MATQALPKVRGFAKGGWGARGHAARRLLPRAGAKVKLRSQGQQAAEKSVQGSIKRKSRLLQMQSPFYAALPLSRNVSRDSLPLPAAAPAQPSPGAPGS